MSATGYSATVKGGLYETNGVTTLTPQQGKSPWRRYISQILGKKSMFMIRAKMNALTGAATGGAVSKTYGRIQDSTELGGARVIEQQVLASGVSDAADVTEIKGDFFNHTALTTFGSSPPINLDRNPLGTR